MSANTDKIKLDVDWESLFPGKDVSILGVTVNIQPLGLEKLAEVAGLIKRISSKLTEAGVTWENYTTPKGIIPLLDVCLRECPDILSEVTGVCIEDLKRLPIAENLTLLTAAIDVNIESKDSMEKNFESLSKHLEILMKEDPEETSKTEVVLGTTPPTK